MQPTQYKPTAEAAHKITPLPHHHFPSYDAQRAGHWQTFTYSSKTNTTTSHAVHTQKQRYVHRITRFEEHVVHARMHRVSYMNAANTAAGSAQTTLTPLELSKMITVHIGEY